MRERTLILSGLMACCIHVLVLFLNFGITPAALESAIASINVSLVAPPEAATESEAAPPEPAEKLPDQRIEEPPPELPHPEEPAVVVEQESEPEPEIESDPVLPYEPPEVPDPFEEIVDVASFPEEQAAEALFDPASEPVSGEPLADLPSQAEITGEEAKNAAPAEYSTATVDRGPEYAYNPKPAYPRSARRREQEGTVLLSVEVLPTGRVGEIHVEKSSGYDILDKAAIKAVRKWHFKPAEKGGGSVGARVRIPVEFDLTQQR